MIAAAVLSWVLAAPVSLQDAVKAEADRTGKPIAFLVDDPEILNQPVADFEAAVKTLHGRVVTSENGTVIQTPAIEKSLLQARPPAVDADLRLVRALHGIVKHVGARRAGDMVRNNEAISLSELPDSVVSELDSIMNLSGHQGDLKKATLSFALHPKASLYANGTDYYGINLSRSPEGLVMRHPNPSYERTGPETKIDLGKVRMVMRESRRANGAAIPLSEFIQPFAGSHLYDGLHDSLIWAYSPDGEFLPQDRLWLAAEASGLVWRYHNTDSAICLYIGHDRRNRMAPEKELIDFLFGLGLLPDAIEPHAFRGGSFMVSDLDGESRSALWGTARLGTPEPESKGVSEFLNDDSKFSKMRCELSLQGMLNVQIGYSLIGHSFSIR